MKPADFRCRGCGRKPTAHERGLMAKDFLRHPALRSIVVGWWCLRCRERVAGPVLDLELL